MRYRSDVTDEAQAKLDAEILEDLKKEHLRKSKSVRRWNAVIICFLILLILLGWGGFLSLGHLGGLSLVTLIFLSYKSFNRRSLWK
ncbi:MAG TPA: hypothetical protein DCL41_06570 [Bdellovibrionales bacterium]|nr:hypothetical protein [Pseudobdellovibrionaceae bacterium]HAG91515.1 hypothetical protein [Bdellovibrionales bacterium]|tara:strand:- start:3415 stop:3672 length:258 start_codon:yes stop_codon:yes gene_type:complete